MTSLRKKKKSLSKANNEKKVKEVEDILSNVTKGNYPVVPNKLNSENFTLFLNNEYKSFQKRPIEDMWKDYTDSVYPEDEYDENLSSEITVRGVTKKKRRQKKIKKKKTIKKRRNSKNKNIKRDKNIKTDKNIKRDKNTKKHKNSKKKGGANNIRDIDDRNFACDVPECGINLTQLGGERIFGMARPNGADVKESVEEECFCFDLDDCIKKLGETLQQIYNRNIRGYINLESLETRDNGVHGDYGDLEQEIWEELGREEENTIYENLPTLDMSGISKINLGKIQEFYEINSNINIVFHCYCGKGRTGNAI